MNSDKEIKKLFYMGFPMYGWQENGEWFVTGFFRYIPILFPVSEEGWLFIEYKCCYLRVLYKFLRGDFVKNK
ncbi:hypothetical protein CH380_19745 [Leptospira adleri]|uniref:Uncharacterized protein n=1 Tax=Leptospira adleri TaxID=2023186 RepID=A0A2M9YJ06_9LEPT|nr:hypothetical protein CH380_19745 [Leptospira adleri]PJZ61570.1 hypothetical protein CH376_12340 [Leptospira adleri]